MTGKMIKMVATKTHPTYKEGEEYEVSPAQAASDVYLHRAMFKTDQPTRDTRRRYRRRDMQAE